MPRKPPRREYEAAARLREAIRLFLRHTDEITRSHHLTPQRYQLLLMIKTARRGGERATLGELRERLQLAQSSLVELVHRAEDAGLVRRELSRDNRRLVHVGLTAEGERRLAGAVADLARHRARLVSILSNLEETGPAPFEPGAEG